MRKKLEVIASSFENQFNLCSQLSREAFSQQNTLHNSRTPYQEYKQKLINVECFSKRQLLHIVI